MSAPPSTDTIGPARALHGVQGRERHAKERAHEQGDERPEQVQAEQDREAAEDEVEDVGVGGEPERELAADPAGALVLRDDVDRVRLDLRHDRAAHLRVLYRHTGLRPGC